MPLSVDCPECGAHYNVPDKLAGKKARCKKCGAVMPIPSLGSDRGEDDSLDALAELVAPPSTPARRGPVNAPPGWTPESVIIEKDPNPGPSVSIGSGRWQRNSGGIGRFLKPLVLLVVLGGLAYGGWYLYTTGTKPGGFIATAKDKLTGGNKEPEKPKVDPKAPPPPSEAELKRNESAEDLRKIYAALTTYTTRNQGSWPADLATLKQDGTLAADALESPFGPAFATGDYVYKPYTAEVTPAPDAVLGHDAAELGNGEGANVLFGDGSVRWLDKSGVQAALQRSEEVRTAAVKQREEQVAAARQQEQQRAEREKLMRTEAEQRRAEMDPSFRPAGRRDVADRIQSAAAGLVKDVQDIAMRRGTEQFIRPATAGSAYAVLVRNQGGDTVEVFDGKSTEPGATAQFPTDERLRNNPGVYALSPDGKAVVRLESFPNLRAVVHSLESKSDQTAIDLDDRFGEPTLVGFLSNDRFVVRWQKMGNFGVEVWDAKSGRRGRQTDLFQVQPQPSPGSEALSPDGRTYAIVDENNVAGSRPPPRGAAPMGQRQLQVVLYDVVAGGQPRRFQVPQLNAMGVQPAGLAFSPDRTRLAALFVDAQGRAVVMQWNMANGKSLPEHVVPEKLDVPRAGFGRARALDWVAGGRGLLVAGRTLMNPESGAVLATLDAGKVLGQAVTNETTVHLGYGDMVRLQGVAVVPLDESKLPAKPAATTPGRAMASPQPR
jgi:prepilin-type processing-associated H-X9-DG protein